MSDVTTGSLSRLRSLPAVFTSNDAAALLDTDRKVVDQYLFRWRKAGLVTTLGQRRASVHFNNLLDPRASETMRGEALARLLNRPVVLVGGGVLNAEGWTNQYRLPPFDVAVGVTPASPTVPTDVTCGIRIMPRPVGWMLTLLEDAEKHDVSVDGVPSVSPAMALADSILCNARGVGIRVGAPMPWLPAPDDIEADTLPEKTADTLEECMEALEALPEEVALVSSYRSAWESGFLNAF